MPAIRVDWRPSAGTTVLKSPSAKTIRQGGLVHHRSSELYALPPIEVDLGGDRRTAVEAMGATLYIPSHRRDLGSDLLRMKSLGLTSVVLDLEDAVADRDARQAWRRAVSVLRSLDARTSMAVFVRLRSVADLGPFLDATGSGLQGLAGFAVAKARPAALEAAVEVLDSRTDCGHLLLMPILETAEYVRPDLRVEAITRLGETLERCRSRVLCLRVGGTDLAGLHGIRRSADVSIHEVHFLAAALGDVVSVLGGEGGFCVTGVVWEHLMRGSRVLRPQLRQTPFMENGRLAEASSRPPLVHAHLDGLIREVLLDRANGLVGKTVIHPDQALVVAAMGAVDHVDFIDAHAVLGDINGGAETSVGGTRMNEHRPHRLWAEHVLARARACGVLRPDRTFADALDLHFEEAAALMEESR